MNAYLPLTLISFCLLCSFLQAQNRIGTGVAQGLYEQYCANCHGQKMEGGTGGSLIDGNWKHGASDEAIASVIRNGLPELGMEAYGDTLTEQQIRALVILIREQNEIADKEALLKQTTPQEGVFQSEQHDFRLEKIAEGEGILWGMDALPDGRFLVTEKSGRLWILDGNEWSGPIEGIPEVVDRGQGGLLEVAVHPDYASHGWIYLGFSESISRGGIFSSGSGAMTSIVRGRIQEGQWIDEESIFRVDPEFALDTAYHYGTRIVFQDGYLFFSIGDRGRKEMAQNLSKPNGKIHRIHEDGRIPQDNPFLDEPNAFPSIWCYGNRNPQGLALHPETGALWQTEHGPRGGDEVNLIKKGLNYGWPEITYGMNYSGTPITDQTAKPGMEQPVLYWTPSIAVCGIDFYTGDLLPRWKNHLFVGGLASEELHRLVIQDGGIVRDEILFKNQGRVRDVFNGPDGYLYVLLESGSPRVGSVYRLVPVDQSTQSTAAR